jgi:hypothetical protein
MKQRSAQPTIDLFLRENIILSITLYVVAVLSVVCGIVMLGFGVWRNQPILALAGVVETYLFIPAWRFVQELRRENRLIRLLETDSTVRAQPQGPWMHFATHSKRIRRVQQATTHPELGFSFFSTRAH